MKHITIGHSRAEHLWIFTRPGSPTPNFVSGVWSGQQAPDTITVQRQLTAQCRSYPPIAYGAETFVLYRKHTRYSSAFTNAAGVASLQLARLHGKRRNPRDGQPASASFALGWPRRKDGRHAQSSLPQRAPERKQECVAPRKRYKDQLKRWPEQSGCNHLSWRLKASDRDSCRSLVRGRQAQSRKERTLESERASSLPKNSHPGLAC